MAIAQLASALLPASFSCMALCLGCLVAYSTAHRVIGLGGQGFRADSRVQHSHHMSQESGLRLIDEAELDGLESSPGLQLPVEQVERDTISLEAGACKDILRGRVLK